MSRFAVCLCMALLLVGSRVVADAAFHPRTLLGGEYWGTVPEEGYLEYLDAVKPDLIHGAVVGPELAGSIYGKGELTGITAVYPKGIGTIGEYLAWWKSFNEAAHKRGVKVQATTSLTFVWGDMEKHTGFFKYYDDLWEDGVLGAKPAPGVGAFLRKDKDGNLVHDTYGSWYTFAGCLNNPVWRQLQKQMVKSAVDAGFDGFMVQFPYFDNRCVCEYCQEKFKKFLAEKFTREQLASECGIPDLGKHAFPIIGSPDNKFPALELAAREFGAICVKDCFDDIFVNYGRTLKPDLVLSMWTHFRQFVTESATNASFANYLDERTLLPIDRWGKGENYLWYSSPGLLSGSDLKNGINGDSALDGRVLRAMAGTTPFEILKYDYYRWRLVTAESLALGGICFGSWKGGWSGGSDRETPHHLQTYYRFMRDNDAYLNPRKRDSYAEVAMLYPRQALFAADAAFFEPFRNIGRALLKNHVLFDVVIDQKMTAAELARHRVVIVVDPRYLSRVQGQMLKSFVQSGGKVVLCASGPDNHVLSGEKGFEVVSHSDREATMQAIGALTRVPFSTFAAPWTVEMTADRQAQEKRVLLHLVNYNRDESQQGKELPIAAAPVQSELRLPAGMKVAGVTFLTPEVAAPESVQFRQKGDRILFTTPKFLVYGLVVVQGK